MLMLGEKNLNEARKKALELRPWYGPFLVRFVFVRRDSPQPLFHDQLGRVYFNDGYATFAKTEVLSVLLIQIAEMFARGLFWRRMGRNPQLWAFACLLDTASSLQKQGLELPRESLKPAWFHFPSNKTAEYYYGRLEKLERVNIPFTAVDKRGRPIPIQVEMYWEDGMLKFSVTNAAVIGGFLEAEDGMTDIAFLLDPLLFSGIQQEVFDLAAEFQEQRPGDMPDWLIREVNEQEEPILPWHEHVRHFLGEQAYSGTSNSTSTFIIPSLLFPVLPAGTVLPYYQPRSPSLALVIDTSGSMTADLLSRAVAEIAGLLRTLQIDDGLTVVPCDAAAHTVQNIFSTHQLLLEGGGGTDIGKGLEKVAELPSPPEAAIVLTDGYTSWPPGAPKNLQVLVVIVSKKWPEPEEKRRWPVPPWARVVEMFPYTGNAA